MKIKIAETRSGRREDIPFSFAVTAAEIDAVQESYSFPGTIRVEGRVTDTGRALRVTGIILCKKAFVCDRCLKECIEEQRQEFAEDFCRAGAGTDDENGEVNLFQGEEIELDAVVRDTLLAAQPVANVCCPDCKGLCPQCGANLNEGDCGCERFVPDPRLASLQQLLHE